MNFPLAIYFFSVMLSVVFLGLAVYFVSVKFFKKKFDRTMHIRFGILGVIAIYISLIVSGYYTTMYDKTGNAEGLPFAFITFMGLGSMFLLSTGLWLKDSVVAGRKVLPILHSIAGALLFIGVIVQFYSAL